MHESLVAEGLDLMLFGMGTVFVFLTLLVLITGLMSSLITRFLPEPLAPASPSPAPVAGPTAVADEKVIKIIQAAIDQHRARR